MICVLRCILSAFALLHLLVGMERVAANNDLIQQGQYIFSAAGCITCHTVDEPLAGGRAIDSTFGTFYSPNITPHREDGIGNWTQEYLIRAMREGISPDGEHYYPSFPYPSYTKMERKDIIALYTYLMAQPAIPKKNLPHELGWAISNRSLIALWKQFWFNPGELQPDKNESPEWSRGQYIAMALWRYGARALWRVPHSTWCTGRTTDGSAFSRYSRRAMGHTGPKYYSGCGNGYWGLEPRQ